MNTASVSHASAMDRQYRFQRHIYDLTRKYYLLGRDNVLLEMQVKPGQTLLELGCGTGRNLRLAAKAFPQAALFGLDISEQMLTTARAGFERRNLPLPALAAGDASQFQASSFGCSGFDHILISYALSMIPAWENTIDCAIDALNPGGTLHIVDFGQQERLPHWFRAILIAWLHKFHVTPRATLETTIRESAERKNANWQFAPLYRGYAWSAKISRPHQ